MKSNINTGTINTNYPVPGVNNSSQGFRDNFAGIKTNLETASTEISDLQGKVLVKSALTGDTMNNDMAGGQISNVLTLGFRKTTYNLGSNLSNTVDIDCTKADVHWGTVTGDMSLTFSKWAPAETLGTVEVILTVTPGRKITLPASVTYGQSTIEGCSGLVVTVPAGVTRLHWVFTSIDCGTTVEIMPVDTPRTSTDVKLFSTPAKYIGLGSTAAASSTVTLGAFAAGTVVVGDRIVVASTGEVLGIVTAFNEPAKTITLATTAANTSVTNQGVYATSSGTAGQIKFSNSHAFFCVADYHWKRIALGDITS